MPFRLFNNKKIRKQEATGRISRHRDRHGVNRVCSRKNVIGAAPLLQCNNTEGDILACFYTIGVKNRYLALRSFRCFSPLVSHATHGLLLCVPFDDCGLRVPHVHARCPGASNLILPKGLVLSCPSLSFTSSASSFFSIQLEN